jgi:hypothetical protein
MRKSDALVASAKVLMFYYPSVADVVTTCRTELIIIPSSL